MKETKKYAGYGRAIQGHETGKDGVKITIDHSGKFFMQDWACHLTKADAREFAEDLLRLCENSPRTKEN